jgi:hypothetical protein
MDLSQLTPDQKQAIMVQAQQEANQAIMQKMMQSMMKTCFDKCAGTSVRIICCSYSVHYTNELR